MSSTLKGNLLAAFSFVLWGLSPIYYHFLPNADLPDLFMFRIIFAVPFMYCVFKLMRQPIPKARVIFSDKQSLFFCGLATTLMCVSWGCFMYALTHGKVLAASLGFFINPLVAIALGVLVLKEHLSKAQIIAITFGIIGIAYQVFHYGHLPWLSLAMGTFFALYGLNKKMIRYDALTSVTVEHLILLPLAIAYFVFDTVWGTPTAFEGGISRFLLYVGVCPVTLIPLILFALACRYTTLTMVGLMQYVEPTLQFLLATLIFQEPFDHVKAVSFALIWIGLVSCGIGSHHVLKTNAS